MTDMEQMAGSGYNSHQLNQLFQKQLLQPRLQALHQSGCCFVMFSIPKMRIKQLRLSESSSKESGRDSNLVEFRFPANPDPSYDRANFTLPANATYKDLKNAVKDRKAKFEANPPEEWVERQRALKGEGSGSSFTETSEPSSGKEVATLQPSIKRLPNFETEGKYEVTIGDKTYHIYRDPESGMWFDANAPATSNHLEGFLGFSKKKLWLNFKA